MLRRSLAALLTLIAVAVVSSSAAAQVAAEIPTGTAVKVRITETLDSSKVQPGDTFHGTLEEPISVNGREIYPKGADITGRVSDVKPSGRLSEPGELDLVLGTIASGSRASSVVSDALLVKGASHAKSNAAKIGGGAALGAIIGSVAGGGKGAAIGAAAGGAAGTGAAAATGKREAIVQAEAVLTFTTSRVSQISARSTQGVAGSSPESDTLAQNLPSGEDANESDHPRMKRQAGSQAPKGTSAAGSPAGSSPRATGKSTSPTDSAEDGESSPAQSGRTDPYERVEPDEANLPDTAEPRDRGDQSGRTDTDKGRAASDQDLDFAFTARDRRVIRNCVSEHLADLPNGITRRPELPAGNERALRQGATLPSEIERQSQPLPLVCEQNLSKLPSDLERVVYNGRVLLLNDSTHQVVDLFYLDESR